MPPLQQENGNGPYSPKKYIHLSNLLCNAYHHHYNHKNCACKVN